MQEEWRPVVGFEGYYEASSMGRIASVRRAGQSAERHIKTPFIEKAGYHRMCIWKGGRCYTRTVHGMVAEAFLGSRPPGMQVNHLDGDKANNKPCNLAYVSALANSRHAVEVGLIPRGENSASSKLTEKEVREIRALKGKVSGIKLGLRYGLSRSATYSILTGKTWKHLL